MGRVRPASALLLIEKLLGVLGKAKDPDSTVKKLPLPTSIKALELEKSRLQLSSLRWAHLEEEGALWALRKFPERYPLF